MSICADWLMNGKKPSGLPIHRAGISVKMHTVKNIARFSGEMLHGN
jgi:hypothetical protein